MQRLRLARDLDPDCLYGCRGLPLQRDGQFPIGECVVMTVRQAERTLGLVVQGLWIGCAFAQVLPPDAVGAT